MLCSFSSYLYLPQAKLALINWDIFFLLKVLLKSGIRLCPGPWPVCPEICFLNFLWTAQVLTPAGHLAGLISWPLAQFHQRGAEIVHWMVNEREKPEYSSTSLCTYGWIHPFFNVLVLPWFQLLHEGPGAWPPGRYLTFPSETYQFLTTANLWVASSSHMWLHRASISCITYYLH